VVDKKAVVAGGAVAAAAIAAIAFLATQKKAPPGYSTLTVSSGSGGSVTVAIGSQSWTVQGGYSQDFNVPIGATVTLTATPESGYVFSSWQGVPS
jgi:hypothetical protein